MPKLSGTVSALSRIFLVVISSVSRTASWCRRAVQPLAKPLQAYRAAVIPDFSRRTAYIYLALFVPAIASIVLSNWKWNAITGDTLLLFSSLEMVERFSSLFSNANSSPLQGLFDILPSGLRADPIPNIVGRALFGPGMHVDFLYVFYAVLLAYAVAAMARAAGMRWGVAVLAGILTPLLIFPTFGMFPLVQHFYILWPVTYYATAGTVLVTALFWLIDDRSAIRTAILTAVIAVVLIHLSMIQILFMTLLAPAMIAMGVGALAISKTRAELLAKIISAVAIVVALAGAGIFHYLYAIGINTASHVFYLELMDFMLFSGPSWGVILDDIGGVIVNPFNYSFKGSANIDGVLAPVSQLGAIYLAIFGKTREARIFGRTVIAWILATAFFIAIVHNFYYHTGIMYQGPDPRHLVPILWPYYTICFASLVLALAELIPDLLARAWPTARRGMKYVSHALVILLLAGPVTFIVTYFFIGTISPNMTLGKQIFHTYLPSFTEYKRYPIIDYLESNVGVAIDREFRGSAVAMPTDYDKDTHPYKAWRRETTFAYARAYLGNDFGAFGLRHFNIPTIDQETHNIAPQYYLTVRELLSRPGIDAYDKHFTLVTRLNEPIMALLGLRYLIADYELPIGTQRLTMPIPEEARKVLADNRLYKSPMRLYELPDPNIGNYSPTNVVHAKTARAMITAMASPDFNGRKTVVTDDTSIKDNLVAATGAAMTVRMGGVGLRASSTGQSVLVLPVQYSHCWRVVSGEGVTLFRANLMQLGVRFSGELRAELRQVFGPFWQSSCRVADAADADRLLMAGAVGTIADMRKTAGDGINRIPSPETLDAAIGNSAIATIKVVSPPNAKVREYTIKAEGPYSEHYAALNVPNLTPGTYTLSMQVRSDSPASRMYLQINDGANGVVADFLLPTRNVWVNRLGKGENLNATIRPASDGWLDLTVTSNLATSTANIYVHLTRKGNGTFTPSGEAVTIRGVKLERGETATPYPGLGN